MTNELILIVDDNQKMMEMLQTRVLEPLGYQVLTAANGQMGLDLAIEHTPDLILLDMSMPKMTGIEMLKELRQTLCDSPVIFMTAENSIRIAVDAFRMGVVDYLAKPFSLNELETAIDHALAQKRLNEELQQMQDNLLKASTIRETMITLSHYLNNDLMCIEHHLETVKESETADGEALELLDSSFAHLERIKAVMKILKQISQVNDTNYHDLIDIIDIEEELKNSLNETSFSI